MKSHKKIQLHETKGAPKACLLKIWNQKICEVHSRKALVSFEQAWAEILHITFG
jgi:hypothetical protein